jgi:enoyl-CoA hydratase/carnithine racemase
MLAAGRSLRRLPGSHSLARAWLSGSSTDAAAPVTITVSQDGIATVKFDAVGEKVNTLSAKMFASFEGVLNRLETDPTIRAAVLISGKPDSFIAGADITMLVWM